jgi:hypothetical protein
VREGNRGKDYYAYRGTNCYDIAVLSTAAATTSQQQAHASRTEREWAVPVYTLGSAKPEIIQTAGELADAARYVPRRGGVVPRVQEPKTLHCLMIQQPLAWAVFHGRTVDSRAQLRTTYRGPLAIHASARWSDRGGRCPLVAAAWNEATTGCSVADYGRTSRLWTARGEIIGLVDLVDVHLEADGGCCQPWAQSAEAQLDGRRRRRMTHLVLENPRALPDPIWCKGTSGLWAPPADIARHLNAFDSLTATRARQQEK